MAEAEQTSRVLLQAVGAFIKAPANFSRIVLVLVWDLNSKVRFSSWCLHACQSLDSWLRAGVVIHAAVCCWSIPKVPTDAGQGSRLVELIQSTAKFTLTSGWLLHATHSGCSRANLEILFHAEGESASNTVVTHFWQFGDLLAVMSHSFIALSAIWRPLIGKCPQIPAILLQQQALGDKPCCIIDYVPGKHL